ncbi:MAG: hypothetical protein ACLPPF_00195 [Rhodomicrobium sp.]
MPEDNQLGVRPKEWRNYNTVIPVPACRLPRDELKRLYQIIDRKQKELRDRVLAQLEQAAEETEESFAQRAENVRNAFVTVVTIKGFNNEDVTANAENIFEYENLPNRIKSVFYSTKTGPQVFIKFDPQDSLQVFLDFSAPPLLNFHQLPTLATPNGSTVTITATNEQWFSASKQRLTEFFEERRTGYDWLHAPAIYDLLLSIIGLPIAVWASIRIGLSFQYIDKLSPIPRGLFYAYIFYFSLVLFRIIFSYARWAFPKIEMSSNMNSSQLLHRTALGAIVLGIVGSFAYDIIKTVF